MRWMRKFRLALRAVFRKPAVEREMDAELVDHFESEVRDLMARGVAGAEARRQARASMGRLDAIREECRDSRGTAGWDQLRQDVAFGVRVLLKNRTFAVTALATVALGIGSTTAVFSLIDAVLLRPLPFPAPERLYQAEVGMRGPFDTLRANSRAADYAAHLGVRAFSTPGHDWPERVEGSEVSANFFEVLGVGPLLGRTFEAGEDRPGRNRVVVLSHEFWRRRYGARPDAIGQHLVLDEAAWEIAGVMPASFHYPAPEAALWVPMRLDARAIGEYWGSGGVVAFARLRPGMDEATAQAELRTWMPRIRGMFPWRMPDAWGALPSLVGLQDHLVADSRTQSWLLLGVVVLVLLIAIANVANLMLGQTAARRREFAMRTSLGATPGRLTRQLLTEAVVLAAAGGAFGIALAFGQLALLQHWLPADTPRLAEAAIDRRMLAFTAVLSLGSGLLFGILPALRARRQEAPREAEGRGYGTSRAGIRSDTLLVVAEAAFATMLLVSAGLLLRSLTSMLRVDPGFRAESLVTAQLTPGKAMMASRVKLAGLYREVREKLAAYPGVRNAGAANVLPLTPDVPAFAAAIEDHPRPVQELQIVLWSTSATPEYLDTLGVRLLAGRAFTDADSGTAPLVVLVSRTTAERYWPGRSPIGRRLKPVWDRDWRTVVGVVDDVKYFGIAGPPDWVNGEVYVPLAQTVAMPPSLFVVARVTGDAGPFESRLPWMVKEVCATCAVSRIARMESVVAGAVSAPRSTAGLVGSFAVLALLLSSAGVYGVISHAVLRRTREIGVRLALGAGRGHVAWVVAGASLGSTLAGALAGLGGSWVFARWMRTLLFGIPEHDWIAFSAAALALVAVSILASLVPVWRASRIDPVNSLREG